MTAETIAPTIGIYSVSFLTVLFFIWLLAITIKKELVKVKKKSVKPKPMNIVKIIIPNDYISNYEIWLIYVNVCNLNKSRV